MGENTFEPIINCAALCDAKVAVAEILDSKILIGGNYLAWLYEEIYNPNDNLSEDYKLQKERFLAEMSQILGH